MQDSLKINYGQDQNTDAKHHNSRAHICSSDSSASSHQRITHMPHLGQGIKGRRSVLTACWEEDDEPAMATHELSSRLEWFGWGCVRGGEMACWTQLGTVAGWTSCYMTTVQENGSRPRPYWTEVGHRIKSYGTDASTTVAIENLRMKQHQIQPRAAIQRRTSGSDNAIIW